jgi:hypothetical protein
MYVCTATNTWTLTYTPAAYPHQLVTGAPPSPPDPPVAPPVAVYRLQLRAGLLWPSVLALGVLWIAARRR